MTETKESEGLLAFLRTEIPTAELATPLKVIQAFKQCEGVDEWMQPFEKWVRLEQLEDYLRLLTGTEADNVDDDRAIKFLRAVRSES